MATALRAGEANSGFVTATSGTLESPLEQLPLFRDLTNEQLEELLASSSSHRADRQQVIYCEGETIKHLYLVESGSFKLIRHSVEGKELIVSLVAAGECFGALAEPLESHALAQALEASVCIVIPVTIVRRTLSKNPELAVRLLSHAAARQSNVETVAARLAFETVPQRLAHVLLDASQSKSGELSFPLNQTEIANLIGSSRETVCSILNQFRRRRLLDINRGKIRILDRDQLAATR